MIFFVEENQQDRKKVVEEWRTRCAIRRFEREQIRKARELPKVLKRRQELIEEDERILREMEVAEARCIRIYRIKMAERRAHEKAPRRERTGG